MFGLFSYGKYRALFREAEAKLNMARHRERFLEDQIELLKAERETEKSYSGPFVSLLKELDIRPKISAYGTPETSAKCQVMDIIQQNRDARKNVAELYQMMKVKHHDDAKVKILGWRGAEATMDLFAKSVQAAQQ